MTTWSLPAILGDVHQALHANLSMAGSFAHGGTKGAASESAWLRWLQAYLPQRYRAESAHVVDSEGSFSDQIDVVVFDRQYSPFILTHEEQHIIPAESVYAVFEAKQSLDARNIAFAQDKIASVRALERTSLPIPHAGGTYPAKPLIPILGGILTTDSDWSPPLGDALRAALFRGMGEKRLDMGCVSSAGHFTFDRDTCTYAMHEESKPGAAFLFRLISSLQFSGTVPMIDVQAYARWLDDPAAAPEHSPRS